MNPHRVGFLGFDGVMALDLVGPIDAFTSAATIGPDGQRRPCYEVVIIGLDDKPFATESGIRMVPDATWRNAPELDTLLIPGGKGLRVPRMQSAVAEWVKARASRIRRIASVCTGV